MICTKCHKEEAEWFFRDENLCQMCWEEYCSNDYWDWYNKTQGVFCNPELLSKGQ